jgi:glycosyltransferase involved in cell wall biosynthesis
MKIINIITPHFIPEASPCTNRILAYCNVLSKNYKLNVITLTEKGKKIPKNIEINDRITIFYIEQKNYNSRNFFIRAYHEIIYSLKLILKSRQFQADYNLITIPYMFLLPFSFLLKNKKILDVRDIVWEYLSENTIVNKFIKIILKNIMTFSIKQFDLIIVTNTQEEKYFRNLKLLCDIELIANGIEYSKYDKLSNLNFSFEKFTVTYIGNIGLAQKIGVLVEVAENLDEIDFLIIGDGLERKELENKVQELNLKNIYFLGKIDWEKLEKYYTKSSLLFAQLDYGFDSAVPSKLYEYAATGLPILYAGTGEATNFIRKLENAYVLKPNSSKEIIKKIKEIINQEQKISLHNKNYIKENFVRENNSKKLLRILD